MVDGLFRNFGDGLKFTIGIILCHDLKFSSVATAFIFVV